MIWLIVIIALALRLIILDQSLWLDEAINVNNAANLDIGSLIFVYSLGDFHPPLYHLILRGWILLFGTSEIMIRLPSVILGVANVLVIYLIGKKLFEQKTALIAATLLATAPLHIYYSQEARMYMLASFLASLAVYFFLTIIHKATIFSWFGFITTTTLLLYTDYLPYLVIPVLILYLFINRQKIYPSTLRTFIPAFILILILVIPWLTILPKQLEAGLSAATISPAWAQVVGAPNFKNLILTFVKMTIGRISHDNNLLYAIFFAPVAFYVVFLFLISLFRLSPRRSFLWYWFFGPIFLGFILAYLIPVFAYFRFLFVLPAFYLIWAAATTTINWTLVARTLLIPALAINLISTSIYFTNSKFHREDWRSAVNFVRNNATKETIVLFESNYPTAPFDYYNKGRVEAQGALSGFSADLGFVQKNVRQATIGKNRVFLFQYLSGITDPEGLVYQELFRQGFINSTTRDFAGLGFVYEFRR